VAALCKVTTNRVTLPDDINQVELARSVMTCRQTVNRIFSNWSQKGIISRSGTDLVIDIAALQARVNLESL